MNKIIKILVIIGGAFLLIYFAYLIFGSNTNGNDIAKNSSSEELVGSWYLIEFTNDDRRDQIRQDTLGATAEFNAENQISGIAFCNNYSSSYETQDSNITFGPIAVTKKLCEETSNEFELKYLQALEDTTNYKITDDTLLFKSDTDEVLLTYKLKPEVSIKNSNWSVTGYNNGKGGVTSLIIDTEITAIFTEIEISGTSGCNNYSASYIINENNIISVGPITSTERGCDEDIMEQEQQYLTALQNSDVYSLNFNELQMRNENDSLQVSMTKN